MKKVLLHLALLITCSINLSAQSRLRENNAIVWLNSFGTFHLTPKWSLHAEGQWRRADGVKNAQQELFRTGINYKCNDQLTARIGAAFIETHPYSFTPINSMGRPFSEYRTYEMLLLHQPVQKFRLTHRFMLEQRWIGKYSSESILHEDLFTYLNRGRYMLRLQSPEKKMKEKTMGLYGVLQGEIFVGFGKNVGENVFDQNRFALLLGLKLNKQLSLEGGFFSQMLQLPREVQGKNLIQYNRGAGINLYYTGIFY